MASATRWRALCFIICSGVGLASGSAEQAAKLTGRNWPLGSDRSRADGRVDSGKAVMRILHLVS